MASNFRLRVVFEDGAIERMVLPERPYSVSHLKSLLMQHFRIDGEIELQFQNPQSDIMCSLTCTDNLSNKGTIKILMVQQTISNSQPSEDIHHVSTPHPSGSSSEHFCLPTFSHDMDLILSKGNEEYFKHGNQLILIREQRQEILEVVASTLYAKNVCPTERDFEEAAEALIKQFPCIADRSTPKGWGGWKIGLKFKVGKYKSTRERGGCTEVAEKTGNYVTDIQPSRKRPCMVAVSSAQFPQGKSEEELKVRMALEMKKVHKDLAAINRCMGKTFALRRHEIINGSPAITTIESRWPALFLHAQICAEFQRITNQNLLRSFFDGLDKLSSNSERLLNLSREKLHGKFGHRLSAILKIYDARVQARDVSMIRTAALHCLPVLLGEDDSEVFKVCMEAEQKTLDNSNSPVSILSIVPNDEEEMVFLQPCQVNIILEGRVVTSPLHSWSDAFIYLFGLIYVLHLRYPKSMLKTFLFIQQVLLHIDGENLKPKILALSKKL